MFELNGRVALVSGAANGMGRAMALALAEAGADVMLADRDLDGLQSRVRQKVVGDGSFYLVQTRLPAGLFLRTTLINPFTSRTDLQQLLDTIRHAAA